MRWSILNNLRDRTLRQTYWLNAVPIVNIFFDAFFDSTRKAPPIQSLRETSATLMLASSMMLGIVMGAPMTLQLDLHDVDRRDFFNAFDDELQTDDSPHGWHGQYEQLVAEFIMYHALAETFLCSAALGATLVSFFTGMAQADQHENVTMHNAWWRRVRYVYLSLYVAVLLAVIFMKLMLTRIAILTLPWPDWHCKFPGYTFASGLMYTWTGRALVVNIFLIWYLLGLAQRAKLQSISSPNMKMHIRRRRLSVSTSAVNIGRPQLIAHLGTYLRAVGGVEYAQATAFEDFLVQVSWRQKELCDDKPVPSRSTKAPMLTPVTRQRAHDVFADLIREEFDAERVQCRRALQELLPPPSMRSRRPMREAEDSANIINKEHIPPSEKQTKHDRPGDETGAYGAHQAVQSPWPRSFQQRSVRWRRWATTRSPSHTSSSSKISSCGNFFTPPQENSQKTDLET